MDQNPQRPEQDAAAAPPAGQGAPRAPYRKPEVHSDFAPLLALLTSQCDLDVTPNTGGG